MYNTIKNPIFRRHPSLLLNAKRENLKPQVEWVEERANHILVVQLPGFKREEIRVQLNNAGLLFIRGSRLTSDNTFIDIDLSIDVPKDVITDKISGKFEDGRLALVLPKNVITEAEAEAITKVKALPNEATKEETWKKEATKKEEPKQEEQKHEQGKIEEEKKDENISKGKTTSKEAMQDETKQKKQTLPSHVNDAISKLTEAMHGQPTQGNEKQSAAADIIQNEFDSKLPKAEEMPKNKFDTTKISNEGEDVGNHRTKTDEGVIHQEENKVEKAIKGMKENGSDKFEAITDEVKSSKEKMGGRMQKVKLKMNEICKDTPQEIGKKLRKMGRGDDRWLNSKYIGGAVERINRNKNIIAAVVVAFSVGLYASYRLKARSA